MSHLHVAFATKSVERFRARMTLTGRQLIEMWNRDLPDVLSTAASARHGKGQKATGKADHVIINGCFVMLLLLVHAMARGELPLPITHLEATAGARGKLPQCIEAPGAFATIGWHYSTFG
jgi:hypothetical protein